MFKAKHKTVINFLPQCILLVRHTEKFNYKKVSKDDFPQTHTTALRTITTSSKDISTLNGKTYSLLVAQCEVPELSASTKMCGTRPLLAL
jgi:hypothetical protein